MNALVGVLLAAGRARRMGRTKQLMPWPPDGDTPLVAVAFDSLASICDQMVVVVGHEADAVAAALGPRPFTRVDADPDAEMLDSVRAGIRVAQRVAPGADIAVHPADHPRFADVTARRLTAIRADRGLRALLPVHAGRRGHPVVIPAALLTAILVYDGEDGLRGFLSSHTGLTRRIDVDDADIVRDLDRPADVERPV